MNTNDIFYCKILENWYNFVALQCLIAWFQQENEKKKQTNQQENHQDRPGFKIFAVSVQNSFSALEYIWAPGLQRKYRHSVTFGFLSSPLSSAVMIPPKTQI